MASAGTCRRTRSTAGACAAAAELSRPAPLAPARVRLAAPPVMVTAPCSPATHGTAERVARPARSARRASRERAICQGGLTRCGNQCLSLSSQTDCGACGQACAAGLSCSKGQCVASCPLAAVRCDDGACADTGNDPRNCGTCGNECDPSEVCVDGQCAQQSPAVGCNACPCDTCTFETDALCCLRNGAPYCVKSERCPR